jgi:uncharacterized repeat protein (TIGR01451 family)
LFFPKRSVESPRLIFRNESPVRKVRILALILAGAIALCLIGLHVARTQSTGPRRVTNTSEEGININPSISGDGRILAFESTEDIAGAGGTDHFRAIRANLSVDPATFFQMGGTRAVAPAISQDGSRIAFASKDDPLGTNPDGNSEIFLLDGSNASKLIQVTVTSPGDIANRITNGNFQPSMSDDGRFIAFSSNRDLASQNSDGNLEVFVYDSLGGSFTQLTNTSGVVGASDAKLSGNGAMVAYIRDSGATPSAKRDLVEQSRVGPSAATLLAGNVQSLAMTYGRAISDDGARVVFAAETATNTTQVFLFDGRGGAGLRQMTSLGARITEVPLHATISGDGMRIAFAARRSVPGAPTNSDGGVELYVLDIPTSQMSKITNAPSSATADVVSSLNDDGSVIAFNFPRILSGALVNSDLANDSEIYLSGTPARPLSGTASVLNAASVGKEPSTIKAVAPDSIAMATGGALANSTQQPQKLPNGTFPTNVGGTTVTVNGRASQIFFVSPGQVNFLVPAQTEIGTADVVITNSENFTSRGTVPTLRSAPGVFSKSGEGTGPGVILNSDTLMEGPFDPTDGNLRLTIFTTGARNAIRNLVSMGGRVVTPESVIASPNMPGLDEVHLLVPRDLRGAGTVDLFVQSDGRASNPVSVTFTGDISRDILINEALADPPDGIAGDVNRDGLRDSGDDEFIELVNTTAHDIDISGYQLLSRSSSTPTDTPRHTFAPGTILPACTAAVVFGGGVFDPANPAFGGALVVKATSGALSLTNGGGAITLRDATSAIITSFSWGASTGLNGDANQSMTRSPEITGNFVLHEAASGNGGRSFSPGTQVSGAAFAQCNPFVRIDVTPSSAAIDAGANQQFTAKAINARGNEVPGVIFSWQSSNTSVATIDQNGLATSSSAGSTEIRAAAHGTQSAPATLTVREIQRVLTRVDVTPPSATIPATGAQQFTAHGIDQLGNEIAGLTFTWASTDTNAATVDQNGLATGIAQGQSSIRATSQNVTGAASLTVSAPTLVVNEVLADPPTGTDGDANHDGTRDSADDEFVELVNSTGAAINISGWTVRTHSTTSSTETVRHTFTSGSSVPAGEAMVVFGGGTFNPNDVLFGCSRVVKASSGGLSLTNSGLTILVRDGSGNLVTQFSYGGSTGLNGGTAQSLTRSPDITGNFVLHSTIAGRRKLSPGLRVDGSPFSPCPGHPASVTISPPSTTVTVGQTTSFTAQAFDQFGRAMVGASITFASDNSGVATVDSVATNPSTGVATATVSSHNPGTAHITASGTDGTTTANSTQATLTVNGPSLTINDVSLNEGDAGTTTFTFTVSLSGPAPTGGVTFNIATQDGTATTANNDYVARSLTGQTIASGQSTYTFDVTVNGDPAIEPTETFLVNVTNVSGASIGDGEGIGTIINDDSPSLSVSDVNANEGNSGATTFTFTVSSPLPAIAGGITFDIATADGTAIAASGDYVARSLTGQTIPAGQSSYTFDVTVNGDTLVEPNEAFTVNITNVSGATVTDGSGLGTVQNDDTATLVISQVYGGGDNSGAPFRNDFVEIYNRGTATVDFSITPYSIQYASVGSNFGTSKTNLTIGSIAPGRYFLVQESGGTTNGVALPTPDATGTIALAAASGKVALVAGTTALATSTCPGDDGVSPFNPGNAAISDFVGYGNSATTAGHCYEGTGPAGAPLNTTANFRKAGGCVDTNENAADFFVASPNPRNSTAPIGDCKPDITINDVTVTEGNTGTVNATFTVTLSTASASTVTVNFATAGGTATAPADYQSNSGTLTFNPGELTTTITVLVNGDMLDEASETFFVNLTSPTNAVLIDNQGQGTITDNDPAPSLSINDVSVAEGDSGTTAATFTVTLSAASGQTVTVNYATADNTAEAASDYQATSGMLAFTPGDTNKTITVLVNGDTTFEQAETFFLNLSSPTNATISDTQGQGTIINDDAAPPTPTFFITDVSVLEDNPNHVATFTVTLSPSSSQTVTVDFATANGSATTSGNDYQSTSGTLTFNPGDTSKPINVTINSDTLVEPDETFVVNLSNATGGATIDDNQSLGTIQNDDSAHLVISQIYGGGGNSTAVYQHDFVEIFNRGTTTVDFALTPYSVQYAGTSSTFGSSKTDLTHGTMAPGQYFLVQESAGSGCSGLPCGSPLPTPDATGTINLAGTSGKVALVANTNLLSADTCPNAKAGTPFNPNNSAIADFVGYGSAAGAPNCYEGAGPAPAPNGSNTNGILRATGGCTDTDQNASDFATGSLNPRNSGTALHDCNAPPTLTSVTIAPATAVVGVGDTQQFTGQALDQFGQTIGGVTVSFASNDGNIATVDSVSATSGSGSATGTVTGRATGSAEIRASATNGSTNVTSSPATITVEPAAGQILISEFRTRGPGGATDEFIEIYNPTTATVTIGGLVIRSSNNAGTLTTRATITAGTTLGPGCHYLFAPTTFTGGVTANQTFTNGITDDGGVAITRSDLVTIIDAAGMNSGSAYKEGTTLAPLAGTTNQSYERKPGGASGNGTDTNNNASDFMLNVNTSNPQNSSSGCLATNTADLSITKTDSPDPVTVGSDINYTLTVTNNGIGPAQTIVVTDNLASSLTFVSCNSTGVCGGTGNDRTVTFSSLAVGSSATITLTATVNGTGGANISNTASVSSATADPNSGNDSATTTTTVSSADLSMSKLDSPDPVNAGEDITYTLTVTNNSSTIPAQSVTVSDQIPPNTTFVSVGSTPSGWTRRDTTTTVQTGTVTYTRPTLAAGGSATFSITVKVDSGAANNSIISNTANVTSNTPDDNSANNAQTATTTVRTPADLSLSKAVNNATPNVGENVTFTITVSNAGPYAATGVTLKDLMPAGLSYVSDDGAGSYASGPGLWTVGPVAVSGTATLHITATAGASSISGVTNTAEITAADQFDPDSTPNNHSSGEDDQSSVVVTAKSADLSLTKTVDNSSPNVGQDVTFTITLSNGGPNAATNVAVTDLLPSGLTFVSSIQSQGSYASVSGIWTVGTVNASSSATLTIKATVQSSGTITNTAEVTSSDVLDPDSTPNNHNSGEDDQASRIISSLLADLSLTKSVDNATPNVGDNVVFTMTVSNAGPSTATGVQVKDLLPSGLTYVSDNGGGAYVSGTGIWTVGTVATSGAATLHITATPTAASANGVTNTAEITVSDVPDPNSTPNNHVATEDDQKSVTITPLKADLAVTQSDSPDPVFVGNNITYSVTVTNNGPNAAANATLTDPVPTGTTFSSITPPGGWTCNTLTPGATGTITCSTASLVSGSPAGFSIVVNVNSSAKGSTISNTATVSSATYDPIPGNNSAPAATTVTAPSLSISAAASATERNTGTPNSASFTVTLSAQSGATVMVNYATASGTATQGTDFSDTHGTLTFNPGVTTQPISVPIAGDRSNEGNETFTVTLSSPVNATITSGQDVGAGTIVDDDYLLISQLYGGGGTTNTFKCDYVELYNRSNAAISLTGLSLQYAAATNVSGFSAKTNLSGTIPAGAYFLVQESCAASGNAFPVTPDLIATSGAGGTGIIDMSATAGKIALVNTTTTLTSSCTGSVSILDFLGYGTTANCFEGSAPAPAPSATSADLRKSNSAGGTTGCFDSNKNNTDFAATTPAPRNSSSTNTCP